MKNRVTFKTKTEHYLDLLTTIALYESTKKRKLKIRMMNMYFI